MSFQSLISEIEEDIRILNQQLTDLGGKPPAILKKGKVGTTRNLLGPGGTKQRVKFTTIFGDVIANTSERNAFDREKNNIINLIEQAQKKLNSVVSEDLFLKEQQESIIKQPFIIQQPIIQQEIGDTTPQISKTPQDNTLRNALIVGGALLLIL